MAKNKRGGNAKLNGIDMNDASAMADKAREKSQGGKKRGGKDRKSM